MFKLLLTLLSIQLSLISYAHSSPGSNGESVLRGEGVIWLNSPRSVSFSSLPQGKRPINQSVDDFRSLLRVFPNINEQIVNVVELDERGLSQASLSHSSWSYNSFPIYRGGLANRFSDERFNELPSWREKYRYYQENKTQNVISRGQIRLLSPIEKYELFIGNIDFSLTENEWKEGVEVRRAYGRIPTWFGSCHGTAPATIRHIRPAKSIIVPSYNGFEKIVFTPSDIKALLAFAWSKNGGHSAMIGTRCEYSSRTYSESCYDTNPGSFHLAVSNLIGLHGKSLIIDAASNEQVWNRPIVKYIFKYFNPQTLNYKNNIEEAIIDKEDFLDDKFIKLRSKNYMKVVGVRAFVTYIGNTEATDKPNDSEEDDVYAETTYSYDLELDDDSNIIGGMWYERSFPDFAWVVAPDMLPLTREDRLLTNDTLIYDGEKPIPSYIRSLALRSSHRGQVLFRVVDMLLNLSK